MARPRIAKNLAEAEPRDLVHVDGKGRVRSPARHRIVSALYWGTLGTLLAIEAYAGHQLFGVPGLSIAAVLGTYVGWVGSRVFLLQKGIGLSVQSRLDEAEAALSRVARGRFVPRRLRARAFSGLSAIASLRGDAEGALTHLRASLRIWGRSKRAMAHVARQNEVQLLTRLGRLDEARARLDALGPAPSGEYLRLGHHTADLYLAFREGHHRLDDTELHERAHFALGITSAAPLLGLLSWAFAKAGDDDMAALLLDEAHDRHPGELLSKRLPEVHAWMDDRRGGRLLPEAPDEEEEVLVSEPRERRRARTR